MSKQRYETNPPAPVLRQTIQNALVPKERAANGTLEAIQPCHSCRWAVGNRDQLRCHLNPPQIRLPYDNIAAWPVVPREGGGCSNHG